MKIGQFIKTTRGRVGVVVANEHSGGVFRGHCCVWFGPWFGPRPTTNEPVIEHLPIMDKWEMLETPLGV